MRIFDWFKGKRETTLRVNWDETEDIGIFTNYNGEPFTGICYSLHENGNLEEEIEILNGLKHGKGKWYYENNQIESEGEYKDDKPHGIRKFYDVSGRLNSEINFKDGEENGLMKMWFENGQLKQELNIKNGKKDGLYKLWHENGHLIEEGNFKDGEKNGLFKIWFEDGKLKTVFHMKGNIRHGLDKSYIDGKLISEGNMKDGKLDGIWKYYRKGEVAYEGTYEENKPIKESGNIMMGGIMKVERMSKDSITMEELKAMRDKIKSSTGEKESNIFWRVVGEHFGN